MWPTATRVFEARTFAECSDAQIAHYIEANVAAVAELVERASPEVALANHLVMGPVILARALAGRVPYAVKVHGSALEYTVKPEPERFLLFAREGLARRARRARGLPSHGREPVARAGGRERAATHAAGPARRGRRALRAARAAEAAAASPRSPRACEAAGAEQAAGRGDDGRVRARRARRRRGARAAGPRRRPAGRVRRQADRQQGRRPARCRVAAGARATCPTAVWWSSVSAPTAPASSACSLRSRPAIWRQPADRARRARAGGRARERGAAEAPARLPRRPAGRRARALPRPRAALERALVLTGRLDHEELADLLPACEAMVVPSTFPRPSAWSPRRRPPAGRCPSAPRTRAWPRSATALARACPSGRGLLSFPVDDNAVQALAARLVGWLQADPAVRARRARGWSSGARALVLGGVARGVIAAARGELDGLQGPETAAPWRPGGAGEATAVRIMFRPPMRRTQAARIAVRCPARPPASARRHRSALRARCSSRGCRSRAGQRRRDRRQEGVRRQVRLLPHARAREHQRRRRAEPRRSVPREPRRRAQARHVAASVKADPHPEPRRGDAENLVSGSALRTSPPTSRSRPTGPAKTPACSRPPSKRRAPASPPWRRPASCRSPPARAASSPMDEQGDRHGRSGHDRNAQHVGRLAQHRDRTRRTWRDGRLEDRRERIHDEGHGESHGHLTPARTRSSARPPGTARRHVRHSGPSSSPGARGRGARLAG